jgi:hypothetical protein
MNVSNGLRGIAALVIVASASIDALAQPVDRRPHRPSYSAETWLGEEAAQQACVAPMYKRADRWEPLSMCEHTEAWR